MDEEEFQTLMNDVLSKINSVEQGLWYLSNETELDMIGATYAISNLKNSCNEIVSEYTYKKNQENEEEERLHEERENEKNDKEKDGK